MNDLRQRFEAKLKSGQLYPLRECSICQGLLCFSSDGEDLFFDASCGCTPRYYGAQRVSWSDLDFYCDPAHGHSEKLARWVEEPCAQHGEKL